MSEGRWEPEKVEQLALEWRALARRHRACRISPAEVASLCEKIAEVMREANDLADQIDDLKAQLSRAGSPKFAPFAARRRVH